MAIPVFARAGAKSTSTTSAVTPTMPGTISANDFLLLVVESTQTQTISLSTANGFAEITGSPQSTTGTKLAAFWKRAAGADAAPVIAAASDHLCAGVLLFTGAKTTGTLFQTPIVGTDSVSSTTLTATGGTTVFSDSLIIVVASDATDSNTAQFSTGTNSSLASITSDAVYNTTAGVGGGFGVSSGGLATPGTFVSTTATLVTASAKAFMTIPLFGTTSVAKVQADTQAVGIVARSLNLVGKVVAAATAIGVATRSLSANLSRATTAAGIATTNLFVTFGEFATSAIGVATQTIQTQILRALTAVGAAVGEGHKLSAPSFDMGFDFRATAGFVTDPAYGVPVLGESYPHTYTNANGNSVNAGWNAGAAINPLDDVNTNDARIAGLNYGASDGTNNRVFKVDLSSGSNPGAGTYTVDLALGFSAGSEKQDFKLKDTSTVLIDGTNGGAGIATTAGHYVDASLTVIAASSTWIGTTVSKVFATSIATLELCFDNVGTNTTPNHFRLTKAGGATQISAALVAVGLASLAILTKLVAREVAAIGLASRSVTTQLGIFSTQAVGIANRVLTTIKSFSLNAVGITSRIIATTLHSFDTASIGITTRQLLTILHTFAVQAIGLPTLATIKAKFISVVLSAVGVADRSVKTTLHTFDSTSVGIASRQFFVTLHTLVLQAVGLISLATIKAKFVSFALTAVGVASRSLKTVLSEKPLIAVGVAARSLQARLTRAITASGLALLVENAQLHITSAITAVGIAATVASLTIYETLSALAVGIAGASASFLGQIGGLVAAVHDFIVFRRRRR